MWITSANTHASKWTESSWVAKDLCSDVVTVSPRCFRTNVSIIKYFIKSQPVERKSQGCVLGEAVVIRALGGGESLKLTSKAQNKKLFPVWQYVATLVDFVDIVQKNSDISGPNKWCFWMQIRYQQTYSHDKLQLISQPSSSEIKLFASDRFLLACVWMRTHTSCARLHPFMSSRSCTFL